MRQLLQLDGERATCLFFETLVTDCDDRARRGVIPTNDARAGDGYFLDLAGGRFLRVSCRSRDAQQGSSPCGRQSHTHV